MERIVVRYLNGSKANQVEEFPLDHFQELGIGRNPESAVKYDPSQDDLVSRAHAVIRQDAADPTQFTITDLNSRNGTYVNKCRISRTVRIVPGDTIQLGPGGPEFQFDVEPRPAGLLHPTRVAEAEEPSLDPLPPTRDGALRTPPPPSSFPSEAPPPVGRNTVERLIARSKDDVRKYLVDGAAVLLGVIVLATCIFLYKENSTQQAIAMTQRELTETKVQATTLDPTLVALKEVMPPTEIAKTYSPATVYIEASWKLINTVTGGQLYHRVVTVGQGQKQERLPAYILLDNGVVEPYLTEEASEAGGDNIPIGFGGHTGSGFVVTDNGFILTNRHVAATWETRYSWGGDDQPPLPGLLYKKRGDEPPVEVGKFSVQTAGTLVARLRRWVPAKSQLLGGKPVSGKLIEGRHDYLDVTFPKTKLRIPARLVRVSDTADVALVKVDVPQSVTKVEMYNNYDSIAPGSAVTVLGYPAVSPKVGVRVKSQDPLNREGYWTVVPDVTVTPGAVGRIIRGAVAPVGATIDEYQSAFGDVYQLTVNATGAGNSGGPILDDRGRVIGLFTYGMSDEAGTQISAAVPIKYGMELMSITPVLR